MQVTIESTTQVVELEMPDGAVVPARMWEGQTTSGIPVHCFVTRICPSIHKDDLSPAAAAVFERELVECRAPRVPGIPLRLIL